MKCYGLPYMGSKNSIAEWVVGLLPSATRLYDVFAGGCAVTHAALASGKFKEIHANDITDSVRLFEDALNGDLAKYGPEGSDAARSSLRRKTTILCVRLCYSFGNNMCSYLYSRELEPRMKTIHQAVFAPTVRERIANFRAFTEFEFPEEVQRDLAHIRHAQRIERIENLRTESRKAELKTSVGDYRDVEILPGSVIYADPPYLGKKGYGMDFNHESFYAWCEEQSEPVFISSYWMPEDRFVCVAEREKRCTLSAANNTKRTIEKIFVPRKQYSGVKNTLFD